MAGLGLLLGGLAGAGRGAAQIGAEGERQAFERERMRLDEERAARIDELRRNRDRAAGLKMGQEIDAAAAGASDQAAADSINARFGSSMSAEDAQVLRGNEEARKAYGLLGSTRQSDLEARATAAEKLGYLDAARETRGQIQTEQQGQRYEKEFESRERRSDLAEKVAAENEHYRRLSAERQARIAEAEIGFRKAQAAKMNEKEEKQAERELRLATRDALLGVGKRIDSLEEKSTNPMLAPEQKVIIDRQLADAYDEAKRYRAALAAAGLAGSEAPPKPFSLKDYAFDSGKAAGAPRQAAPAARSAEPAPAPAERQSPKAMATAGLDRAINDTVRALTAASNRGDKAEAQRLNELLQEQQAARARL